MVEEWGSFFSQPVSQEMEKTMTQQDSDLPNEQAAPTRRALVGAGNQAQFDNSPPIPMWG